MENSTLTLYLEINKLNYIFFVGKSDEENNFKMIYKLEVPLNGIENNRISDFEKVLSIIKKNIYIIEQKLNHTFKEVVLILDNFNTTFINLTGYKKLNGSQILRENITYILNSLKSYVDKIEPKKTVLHIFNSKYYLDKKKIENLPVGLFGDFYSQELSLILINTNDQKNINNIFENCNLKIRKILLNSFIKCANISDSNNNIDTFFLVKINADNSKILYFENNSLKLEQHFKFGFNIIINDICKITKLKRITVEKILCKIEFQEGMLESDLIEKEFFEGDIYKKIKKKLIYEIVFSRIQEISGIIFHKNININYYMKLVKIVFLEVNNKIELKNLKDIIKDTFSRNNNIDFKYLENLSSNNMLKTVDKLIKFGWGKEAIPVSKAKKSKISRFFEALFG